MGIVKNQNIRSQDDNSLRDARHAHNFFTSNSFQFAPKQKYLYHVVFNLTEEARSKAVNTVEFSKQLSVLVKSADLPSYSVDLETKKQYNRNKNLQTGIKYDSVSIAFHDDNSSVSSTLFEEYYRYYFKDGNKFVNAGESIDYGKRDMFSERVPRYGLDNGSISPFFDYIKIFQMSRHRWRAYTLINPIVERWQHDNLDASDASSQMANTMSVVYEGVLYSEGNVVAESDPAGFASQDTLYDTVPSPLGTDGTYLGGIDELAKIPGSYQQPTNRPVRFNNSGSINFQNPIRPATRDPGGFPNIQFPSVSSTINPSTLNNTRNVSNIDASRLTQALGSDAQVLNSFVNRALMTGNVSGYSVNNFNDFLNLAPNTRNAITDELLGAITGGDRKLQQIASQAIKRAL